jgi:hypothetical protein
MNPPCYRFPFRCTGEELRKTWKTGVAGSGGPQGATDRWDGHAGNSDHWENRRRRGRYHRPREGSSGIFRVMRQGKIRGRRQVKERFIRSLAESVRRQFIGRLEDGGGESPTEASP